MFGSQIHKDKDRSSRWFPVAIVVGLTCTAGAAAGGTVRGTSVHDQALGQIANARLGLVTSDLFDLQGHLTPGAPLEATIPVDGRLVTLDVVPYSSRADEYKVWHSDGRGNFIEVEPGPINTMRGVVQGDRGSFVTLSIIGDALYGRVELSDGETYWFEPVVDDLLARPGMHVIYHADDVLPTDGLCASDGLAREIKQGVFDGVGGPASGGDIESELAIDADIFYADRWGDQTEARVNAVIDQMNVQYERDVDITHKIIGIIIRTEQTYTTNDSAQLVAQLISQWRNNRPESDIVRDSVQLFTARSISGGVIGRAAAIGGMCTTTLGYNFVWSDFNNNFQCATDLSAHELGHTWNCLHCNCSGWTMNPFITCANRFIGGSISQIVAYRNSRNCLDSAPVEGRCCFDDDTCEMLFPEDCVAQGGEPGPQGAQCDSCPAPPGRCCFSDGTCEVMSQSRCLDEGGEPGPPDTTCDGSCPPAVPDNDDCLHAIAIGEGTFEFDSTSASTDGPALPAECDEGTGLSFENDIWYFYTPTCESGTPATVSLCNSGYDTRVAVYIQTGQCPGVLIACNDDACGEGGLRSEVTFDAFQSFLYVIRVGGPTEGGPGELVVSCGGPPPCPEDLDGDGEVGFNDVLQLLAAWGACEDCPEDLNDDEMVGFADLLLLLASWGPCK